MTTRRPNSTDADYFFDASNAAATTAAGDMPIAAQIADKWSSLSRRSPRKSFEMLDCEMPVRRAISDCEMSSSSESVNSSLATASFSAPSTVESYGPDKGKAGTSTPLVQGGLTVELTERSTLREAIREASRTGVSLVQIIQTAAA